MQQTGLLAKYQFYVDVYQIVVEKWRDIITRTLRESLCQKYLSGQMQARTDAHTHTQPTQTWIA
jgi:hypothetical protein